MLQLPQAVSESVGGGVVSYLPTVYNYGIFHRALIVEPTEEFWCLPVLDRVCGARGITCTICPDHLRLMGVWEEEGERGEGRGEK